MERLVIVGAGGHGREILDIVEATNAVAPQWDCLGFAADEGDVALLSARGLPLLGPPRSVHEVADRFVLAIGWPGPRRDVARSLDDAPGEQAARSVDALVHPTAVLGSQIRHGVGLVVFPGAVVTTNVVLGDHVHLNVGVVVSHDCVLGDFVTISPGALVNGNVEIGDDVFVGTAAAVLPGVRIGRGAVIAAGAVVTADVPAGATARGVPARFD